MTVDPQRPAETGFGRVAGSAGSRTATFLTLVLGLVLFVGGVALLGLGRASPYALGRLVDLATAAMAAVLVGGAAVCIGLGGLAFRWGGQRPSLPRGSHRSVVATTLLPIVAAVLAAAGYVAVVPGASGEIGGVFLVAGLSLYGALGAVIYFQGVRSGLVSAKSLGLGAAQVRQGALWGLIGALAILVLAEANSFALQAIGVDHPQLESFRWLQDRPIGQYVMVAIAVSVVAPIVEELFFRGYVFNAYLAEKGEGTAYLASSLIFGAVHGLPTLFVAIFSMGLVLAYLYRRTGTIIAPIIAHVLNNGAAFLALLAAAR